MLIFKYDSSSNFKDNNPFKSAIPVEGITSMMWVERFRTAGEFEIVSPLSAGLNSLLPGGSYITHSESKEIMVVENHDIKANSEGDPDVSTTGRSLQTLFEQRPVGYNEVDYSNPPQTWDKVIYRVKEAPAGEQIKQVLEDALISSGVYNSLPFQGLEIVLETTSSDIMPAIEITPGKENVHKLILKIAELGNLGLSMARTNDSPTKVKFIVRDGLDLTSTVTFSNEEGELNGADYLYSIKNRKNVVFWTSTWMQGSYPRDITSLAIPDSVRILSIDVEDLDSELDVDEENPMTPEQKNKVVADAEILAEKRLRDSEDVEITNVTIATNIPRSQYRRDYLLGDTVEVIGSYNTKRGMRVTEHVEIMDQGGVRNYPTLTSLSEFDAEG